MHTASGGGPAWDVHEAGPENADHAVLLLPGGLCTHAFFEELFTERELVARGVRLVAATLPGFGRTTPPEDLAFENYARLAGELASERSCDVVAGHSIGANVAIEMVAAGQFGGPVVLLAPSLSSGDEFGALRVLDRIGRMPALGPLAWTAALKLMPKSMKDEFPPDRADALVAELANNDPGFCRRSTRHYFEYLDRHGDVATRLCESGALAWFVLGENDDVGITDYERNVLEGCPAVTVVDVEGAGHMLVQEQPELVAELLVAAIEALPRFEAP